MTTKERAAAKEEAKRILQEPNGFGKLLALVRDGTVDLQAAVEAINEEEERPKKRLRRFVFLLADSIMPD